MVSSLVVPTALAGELQESPVLGGVAVSQQAATLAPAQASLQQVRPWQTAAAGACACHAAGESQQRSGVCRDLAGACEGPMVDCHGCA